MGVRIPLEPPTAKYLIERHTMSAIKINVDELRKIILWIDSLPKLPTVVNIETSSISGIGTTTEVWIETKEGEGAWKDVTNYDNW